MFFWLNGQRVPKVTLQNLVERLPRTVEGGRGYPFISVVWEWHVQQACIGVLVRCSQMFVDKVSRNICGHPLALDPTEYLPALHGCV